MTKKILTVFKKEIRDMVRDRRALFAAFSLALFGPVFIVVLGFLIADKKTPDTKDTVEIVGASYAPGLVRTFENAGFEIVTDDSLSASPDELPDSVGARLIISEDFQSSISKGEAGQVRLYVSNTSPRNIRLSRKVSSLTEAYGQEIFMTRMIARGMPLSLLSPIDIQVSDLAGKSFAKQYFGDMITLVFIIAPFAASMSVAIDTLAGERERNSLQCLLAQPVSAQDLVLGKWLMVSAFGIFGTLLTCLTYFMALEYVGSEALQLSMHVSLFNFVMTVFLLLPLAMLIASLQMFVSIQVKSYKEGQTYVSLLTFAPAVVGYVKVFVSDRLPDWFGYLPIISHMESLGSLLFSNEVAGVHMLLSIFVCVVGTFLLLYLTSRKVNGERVLDEA